ncbi:aminotransferase class III-fold pyridoxal phosphate-dependent enzyme [archaeon]|nr:aminotransferase class III-fold pyridoxal phosphate-dependent enzyme [archaeon]MBT6869331.1 aminotransferase class III-fold pyridoxal phosphate-dependent enzyme [archaeon]MBT7380570.1 aminotransferase class III-fold pyridoxal phosphate-dependent enzyme [archaeon]MBT7507808.1 aminotransferase class III-fold pyridoxal phosphate-dependent enzyme [archaeon]
MDDGNLIYLRNLTDLDVTEEYCKWLNDPEVNLYLETRKVTIEELIKYVNDKNNNLNCLFLGIYCKSNDKHIGNIKLEPIDFVNKTATLGILIGNKDYWGKGIATEATKLISDYAFNKLGLIEVNLGVISENKAAIRVYEKVGFKVFDIKKNHIIHNNQNYDQVMMKINPKNEKITAIIQARMGASRLPNKVLLPLVGKPVLWHIVNRLKQCKNIDKIVIATSNNEKDQAIEDFAKGESILFTRGDEMDLVSRFHHTCLEHNINTFVRVTADCPFIDPELVDNMIDYYLKNKNQYDLLSNVHPATYPDGLDLEIIPFEALKKMFLEVKDSFYRECFTTYLFTKSEYKSLNYPNKSDQSKMRWTLDTPEDYEFFKKVYGGLYKNNNISISNLINHEDNNLNNSGINNNVFLKKDIENFLYKNPEIEMINNRYTRNYSDQGRLKQKKMEEQEYKNILIVGCGNIGYKHLKNINSFFKGKISVCDNNEKMINEVRTIFPQVMCYQNLDVALEKEKPTHTIIATPNHLHISFAMKALQHTKNIFIEKPLSHNLEGVKEFLEAARKRNVKVIAGFNLRFHPFVIKLKEVIDNKQLGEIYSVNVNFGSYLPDRHPGRDYREDYVTKRSLGGGAILDVIHEIDYLSWIFGLPQKVFAFAEKRSNLEMETEDSADILLRLNQKSVINFHLDFLRRPYTRIVEVIGEKGTLIMDFAKNGDFELGEFKIFNPVKKEWEKTNHNFNHDQTYLLELSQFVNFDQSEDKISCRGGFAEKVLNVALAVKESAKCGKIIKIEENQNDFNKTSNYYNNIKIDSNCDDNINKNGNLLQIKETSKLKINKSKELFEEAQKLIPGQSQTLSKGYTQFVQGVSPIFVQKGKGSHVFDPDGNEFIDYILALGPITLGYNYPKTNFAIIKQLGEGITFSLPHPLEVELAKDIVETIPCAEMVRFGKNGTDVTSAAVKIARAYTKKEKIAYCGYHGGSADWFGITTALNKGVPKCMGDLIIGFEYNNIKSLENIFAEHQGEIATVIMEPVVFEEPKDDFLQKVKDLAHKHGAVLIFDEMVTGFRVSLGGAQEYYNVTPDLATFGKGVANGMPLSILCGKKEIMEECENVFFSMSFGGEVCSLAAAKTTIQEFKEKNVIAHCWKQGKKIKEKYNQLSKQYGLYSFTKCIGLDVHNKFEFNDKDGDEWYDLKSLFIQETAKMGILCSTVNNFCLSHSDEDINKTLNAFEIIFKIMKDGIGNNNIKELLEGIPVSPVFRKT